MVRIRDLHEYGDEREESVTTRFGSLLPEGDSFTIRYEETTGDFAGSTTSVTCTGNTVVMERSGSYATRLIIEPDRRHESRYETEYGAMLLGVRGERIVSDMNEHGGTLKFTYQIDSNGDIVSRNTLHITVKENH